MGEDSAPDIAALLEEEIRLHARIHWAASDLCPKPCPAIGHLRAAAAWLREQKPVAFICHRSGWGTTAHDAGKLCDNKQRHEPLYAAPTPPVDERRMRCCECGEKFTLVNCGTCLICRGAKMDATEKKPPVDVAKWLKEPDGRRRRHLLEVMDGLLIEYADDPKEIVPRFLDSLAAAYRREFGGGDD